MQSQSPKGTNTQEQFTILGKRCCLKSSCMIKPPEKDQKLKNSVINYPSIGEGNFIKKSFAIVIDGRTITFQDTITIEDNPVKEYEEPEVLQLDLAANNENNQEVTRNKKVVIFKDNIFNNPGRDKNKIDKKNIVKNVASSFLKYIKILIQKGKDLRTQLQLLNSLIEAKKFNNQLIRAISQTQALRDCFKLYLSVQAPNWLQKSKIKDKETYRQAFKIYQKLCERDSGSEEGSLSNNEKGSSNQQIQPQNNSSNNSIYGFKELGNNDLVDELSKFK